jgi:hypothetical protein
MWEQYKKTLPGMQLLIGAVTITTLIWSQRLYLAGTFFLMMQAGAVLGAAWATRLRRLFLARGDAGLPARRDAR